MRYHKIGSVEQWYTSVINEAEVAKGRGKREGTIMFPTTHDITPALLEPSVAVLKKLCDAGNTVLVVSKPHPDCIRRICQELAAHNKEGTDRIFFRFTIGAVDNEILRYWEPNAPSFQDRFVSLSIAHDAGFRTSVSIEPMLDAPKVSILVGGIRHMVTDSIWVGKMNHVRKRVPNNGADDERHILRIELDQTDEKIWEIYNMLKNDPLIRWKESIKSVVGLPLAQEAGEDR